MPVTSVVSSRHPFVNCVVEQLCSRPSSSSLSLSSSSPSTFIVPVSITNSGNHVNLNLVNVISSTTPSSGTTSPPQQLSIPIPISIVEKSGVINNSGGGAATFINKSSSSSTTKTCVVPATVSIRPAPDCRLKEEEDYEPPRKKINTNNNSNNTVVTVKETPTSQTNSRTVPSFSKNNSNSNNNNSSSSSSNSTLHNNTITNKTNISEQVVAKNKNKKGVVTTTTPTLLSSSNSNKSDLKIPTKIEEEEADCDPGNCNCGECETDSLFGDLDHDFNDFDHDHNFVSSSDNLAGNNTDTEEDWNDDHNENSNSDSTSRLQDNDDDDEEDDPTEKREIIPCIHCQVGKDHKVDNLVWPIRLDIDLIETLFQLCPDFFEDLDEVEMDFSDSMDLTSPLSNDPNQQSQQQQNQDISTAPFSTSSTFINESTFSPQPSPPNVQVDDSPLQPSMDRNKESLKVKLLLRRPMTQLVEQGILPPPKTPAVFAGQRVRLERARMGDLLKVKIQQRPARQELVRQHILEDTNARVAPSLAEKQRMLKRARLADSLNDHLIHRPGPLELVQKNILHAPDAQMEQAIKEGVVEFKPTYEGHTPGPQVPNIYLCGEDESSSDLSSAGTPDHSTADQSSISQNSADSSSSTSINNNNNNASTTMNISNLLLHKKDDEIQQISSTALLIPSSPSLGSSTSTLSPISIEVGATPPPPPPPPPLPTSLFSTNSIINNNSGSTPILGRLQIHLQAAAAAAAANSNSSNSLAGTTIPVTSAQLSQLVAAGASGFSIGSTTHHHQSSSPATFNQVQQQQHSSTSKSRSSKKSGKTKSQPKARTIKFHEYKGPPNSQSKSSGGASSQQTQQQQVESSYELLLQQQQLFLQWQLEYKARYPQILLPAVSKSNSSSEQQQQQAMQTATKLPNSVPLTFQAATINSPIRTTGPLLAPAPPPPPPATTTITITHQAPTLSASSPSTIISSNNAPITTATINTIQQSSLIHKPQPIAPAPIPLSTASTTSATTTITIPIQAIQPTPVPMQVTEIKPKPQPIQINQTETTSNNNISTNKTNNNNSSTATINTIINAANNSNSTNNTIIISNSPVNNNSANIIINNNNNNSVNSSSSNKTRLNDWKVHDLKAELKRRNLPVSGSKPQLVERLRQAESNVQDEAVSTTTKSGNVEDQIMSLSSNNKLNSSSSSSIRIKTEMDESSCSSDPMDISESSNNGDSGTNFSSNNMINSNNNVSNNNKNSSQNNNNITGMGIKQMISKKLGILPNNTNSSASTPAPSPPFINASQVSENVMKINLSLVGNSNTSSSNTINNHIISTNVNNERCIENNKKVDEKLIREQQKQIEQLQQALKTSQQQLQQMKSSQQTGTGTSGQKHRFALQQHLQQKMQQQQLVFQLQKLLQMQALVVPASSGNNVLTQNQTPNSPIQPQQQPQSVLKPEQAQGVSTAVVTNVDHSPQQPTMSTNTVITPSTIMSTTTSNIQQQQQVPKIPFTIVKLAPIPNKTATIPPPASPAQPELNNAQIMVSNAPVVTSFSYPQNPFQVNSGADVMVDDGDNSKWKSNAASTSLDITNSDNMDHSWLLKINEIPPAESNNDEIPKEMTDFLVTYDSSPSNVVEKQQVKEGVKESSTKGANKESFKSQMVDDVLEILIRNGELPPSAAQEPQTPTTTGKAPQYMNTDNSKNSASPSESTPTIVPAPPPLPPSGCPLPPPFPPPTFAIRLPTHGNTMDGRQFPKVRPTLSSSMTFSRNFPSTMPSPCPTSNFLPLITPTNDDGNIVTSNLIHSIQSPGTPSILDILQESSSSSCSSPSSSMSSSLTNNNKITIPKRSSHFYFGQNKDLPLSKEAEDILKISKDLSNFGREHAEQAAQNRLLNNGNNNNVDKFQSHHVTAMNEDAHVGHDDDDSNSLSLLLGEVEKDLHLVDDMDVVLEDSSTTGHHNNHHRLNNDSSNNNNNMSDKAQLHDSQLLPSSKMNQSIPMSIDGQQQQQHHSPQPQLVQQNLPQHRKNEEHNDFLDELGLFHSDLDDPMEYSDWLDFGFPNNCNNTSTTNNATNSALQQNHPEQHSLQQQQQQQQHNVTHMQHQNNADAQNNFHHVLHHSHGGNVTENSIGVNFINNNNGMNSDNCNTFFGVSSMDFCGTMSNNESSNQNQSAMSRDPLLSSTRSVDIFTAANTATMNNNSMLGGGFGNTLDHNNSGMGLELKGHNVGGPMSPMSDSMLWDFAI